MYYNNTQGDPGNKAELSFLWDFFSPLKKKKEKKQQNFKEIQENMKTSNNKQVERGNPWQQLKLWL